MMFKRNDGTGYDLLDYGFFAALLAAAYLFIQEEQSSAIRLIGVFGFIDCARNFRDPQIPYGWRGREPSGYITGVPGRLVWLISVLIATMMIFWPQRIAQTFFA